MVVLGRLVGTFEPARVMVTIAQANSASARANTSAPSPPAGTAAGMNGKGKSQLSASPASTATAHAIGGRIMTFAVSVASDMAGLLNQTWHDARYVATAGLLLSPSALRISRPTCSKPSSNP